MSFFSSFFVDMEFQQLRQANDDLDSAQTPAASAPTPGGWASQTSSWGSGWDTSRGMSGFSAETPAASAPTPAAVETPGPAFLHDDYDGTCFNSIFSSWDADLTSKWNMTIGFSTTRTKKRPG